MTTGKILFVCSLVFVLIMAILIAGNASADMETINSITILNVWGQIVPAFDDFEDQAYVMVDVSGYALPPGPDTPDSPCEPSIYTVTVVIQQLPANDMFRNPPRYINESNPCGEIDWLAVRSFATSLELVLTTNEWSTTPIEGYTWDQLVNEARDVMKQNLVDLECAHGVCFKAFAPVIIK